MQKGYLTLVGFLLLAVGLVGLILQMVGLKLSILFFLEYLPPLGKFLIQLLMIFGGVVLMYLSKLETDGEQ